MTPTLRFAGSGPRRWFARFYAALATTRVARFISRHVGWKLDPLLLRLTGGRFCSTLVFPTGLLETRGARSGLQRRNAVIYFRDGGDSIIAASNAGSPRHPAWYHNLRAYPEVVFGGTQVRATVVEDGAEQERLWAIADSVFPSYASYRDAAGREGRTVPIIRLAPYEASPRAEHGASRGHPRAERAAGRLEV